MTVFTGYRLSTCCHEMIYCKSVSDESLEREEGGGRGEGEQSVNGNMDSPSHNCLQVGGARLNRNLSKQRICL